MTGIAIMMVLAAAGAFLPAAAMTPCDEFPAAKMAAMFAAAGEPVTGDDSFGSGSAEATGFCNYTFSDAGGSDVGVQLTVSPFPVDDTYWACSNASGPQEGITFVSLPDLADTACMDIYRDVVSVKFRIGARAGAANIIWNNRDHVPSAAAIQAIGDAVGREWVRLVKM